MEAGRELDQLVAEKVMGWGWVGTVGYKWFAPLSCIGKTSLDGFTTIRAALDDDTCESSWWLEEPRYDVHGDDELDRVPHYSTDIAAAFLVVAKMDDWSCDLTIEKAGMAWYADFRVGWSAGCDTAAHAICLAALDIIRERDAALSSETHQT